MYQLGASWRGAPGLVFIEWIDSQARDPRVAYNHHIFTDGYRFHGRSLGHWADGDSQVWTLGTLLQDVAGGQALAVTRYGRMNDSGANPIWPTSRLLGASVQWRRMIDRAWQLTLAADYLQLTDLAAASGRRDDTQARVQLDWWH
jgi:hypothetical protein